MDNLKLTFPSPHPGTHLLVETQGGAFSHWLEELPSGNMPRYTKEVADAITNINRTEMPITQRIELVKLVDIAYENIHDFYRPLMNTGPYKGKHAPFEELNEVNRLTREMSFAYKICVYAYLDKKPLFGKNKNLANAINMALHYLGLVLLEHYELYAPIPTHIWREVHQLYYYAESKNLSELENPANPLKNCFLAVETTYIRICLISLSNPYHLKRGDHWEVFIYLYYWTIHSIISEDHDDFSSKNCFVIDLVGDDKPQSVKELAHKNNPNYRYLLTQQLNIKLIHNIEAIQISDKTIKNCFSSNIDLKKAIQLLDDMLSSWECKQERQAPRYPKVSKMEVIWRLADIHKVISASDPLQVPKPKEELEKIVELVEHQWTTLNNSDGGTCIAHPSQSINKIDVGLLVGIRKTISDGTSSIWSLGIICWITGNERSGTQVGIQYLKGEIQAVKLQPRKGNKIETRFQQALLLSGEKVKGITTPTLLTQAGLYIEHRPMLLTVGEEEQFIHARLKVNSSAVVDLFHYELAHQHLNPENKMTIIKKPESDTDNLSKATEVITLNAMPLTQADDFNHEAEQTKKGVETLDDMIVSRNK
ncbi:MAG: hypothetical protein ACI9N9_001159 [Enterobacterales bacterium]|jgi:hypothetical protein